jgi:hypothetical protein
MQQARARFEREYEPVESDAARTELRLVELDEQLLAAGPAPRSRPRRPTGAAADYARGEVRDGRRTVQIRGYGAQTALRPTPSELRGPRPDRMAAYAFGFAIFLAVLAVVTGGA